MARAKKKASKKKAAKKRTRKASAKAKGRKRTTTTTTSKVVRDEVLMNGRRSNQGRRYESDEWVEFILDQDAETLGYKDAEVTPFLASKIKEYENNLYDYLVTVLPELGIKADPSDVFDEDAPFNVLMTLRGEGVGIWDGRWDHLMSDREIELLQAELKKDWSNISNDVSGGTLDRAFMDAVYDSGTPLEEENPDSGDVRRMWWYEPSTPGYGGKLRVEKGEMFGKKAYLVVRDDGHTVGYRRSKKAAEALKKRLSRDTNPCSETDTPCFVSDVEGGVLVVVENAGQWDAAYVRDDVAHPILSTADLDEALAGAGFWAKENGISTVGNPEWRENPLGRDLRAAFGAAMGAALGGAWGAHSAGTTGAGFGAAVGGFVGSYGAAHLAEIGGFFTGAAKGVREARGRELTSKVEVREKRANRRRKR